ncbi:TPA: RNA 2',3'-cyclic phosphodiesterase [Candidatus Micrarchaeota archaeon]|nr:RNA 2',3'-cyclic phosphodiesterase [Candidatus Micrarchaeota archaeon]
MRCFVALEPSGEVKAKVGKLAEKAGTLGLQANFVKTDQLHVTLVFLGEIPEKVAQEKLAAFKALEGKLPKAFELHFQKTGFFPKEEFVKVFWAGCDSKELSDLQAMVATALGVGEKDFSGHLTICRIKGRKNLDKLVELRKENEDADFGKCHVGKIVFKKSVLGLKGPTYEDLAEVVLA